MNENTKKDIEDLINDIDEFNEKYITYRTQPLRIILVDALDYIGQKEQECEELSSTNKRLGAELCGKLQNYMRAIDEIEKVLEGYCSNGISEIPQSQMEFTTSLLTICEAKLQKILIITQEVKNN